MLNFLSDYRVFVGAKAALPYIAYTLTLVGCGALVAFPTHIYDWVVVGAKFVGVGASTALFTRFLGGMGLFKDAISDVLGEDRWLDRRNDLDDLWSRISRRIFLPGFVESKGPAAGQFLTALNTTMTRTLLRPAPNIHHGYYSTEASRIIVIRWKDRATGLIEVVDSLNCKFVVFGTKDDEYAIRCLPTSGATIGDYHITIASATLDGENVPHPSPSDGPYVLRIPLKAGTNPVVCREILFTQNIVHDPLYVVTAGHVVWGMNLTIINEISDLSLNWSETGMLGVFENLRSDPRLIQLRTRQVLLPTQGIYIVLTSPPQRVGLEQPKQIAEGAN